MRLQLLVFLSGTASLAYQVIWSRQLALLFGSTTEAVSLVLAAFMAGLGTGSIVIGRRVEASTASGLRLYGWLETGIGAAAVLGALMMQLVPETLLAGFYAAGPAAFTAARIAFCLPFVVLPAFLMGGTLPALIRDDPQRAARLYGVNTLGAASGTLITGFVLISRLGLFQTTVVAAAINLLCGLAALGMSRRSGPHVPAPVGSAARTLATRPPVALTLYAISGFAALGLEVLWTRGLVFTIGSTTYAFSLVVAIVLAGLAIGGLAGSRLQSIGRIQTALAGFTIVAPTVIALVLPELAMAVALDSEGPFGTQLAKQALLAAILVLPSSVLLGAMFPVAARHVLAERPSEESGRLLGVNTLAAVLGALLTGLVLIPVVGLRWTFLILGIVQVAAASAAWYTLDRRRLPAWIATPVVVFLALTLPSGAALEPLAPTERLLFYREGRTGTVSVVENSSGDRDLRVDRISVAGTDPVYMTDQKSLAHLPLLLRPGASRVLTVGFGSGGASWSFSRHPQVREIHAVEIERTVVDAAPFFGRVNGGITRDPRFRLIHDDARTYLRYSPLQYDAITTDCTDLRYKSNALLYTREFFVSVRSRLTPDGVAVAWVPLGGLGADDLRSAMATFAAAFPQVSAWYLYNFPTHYILLVGSATPAPLESGSVQKALAVPEVRADLAEIGMDVVARWEGSLFLDDAGVRRLASGAEINTDDRPILEFRVPLHGFGGSLASNLSLFARDALPAPDAAEHRVRQSLLEGHRIYVQEGSRYGAAAMHYERAVRLSGGDGRIGRLVAATRQTAADKLRDFEVLAATPSRMTAASWNELGVLRSEAGRYAEAVDAFERSARMGTQPAAHAFDLGVARLQAGDAPGAERDLRRAVDFDPAHADAWYNLGLAAERSQKTAEAESHYRRALQADPAHPLSANNLAIVLAESGRAAEALALLETAVARLPDHALLRTNLGMEYARSGKIESAIEHYLEAVRLDPNLFEPHANLGMIYRLRGDRASARRHFDIARQLNPELGARLAPPE